MSTIAVKRHYEVGEIVVEETISIDVNDAFDFKANYNDFAEESLRVLREKQEEAVVRAFKPRDTTQVSPTSKA